MKKTATAMLALTVGIMAASARKRLNRTSSPSSP